MKDSLGRNISYARLSVTDRCNLRCAYCMGAEGVEKLAHSNVLSYEDMTAIVQALAELGINKVRLTGGEPLVRKGIISLVELISGIKGIEQVALTTNGQLLARYADSLRAAGVSAVNISLDTLNERKYKKITNGGNINVTLQGIDAAIQAGFEKIKINAVLLKGINEKELHSFALFCKQKGLELRFIELMPFADNEWYSKEHYVDADTVIASYPNLTKIGQSDKVITYGFDDGCKIGFILPVSHSFCHSCNRIRITSDGFLIGCLLTSVEYDLKPYLQDKNALKEYIAKCITKKPPSHNLKAGGSQSRCMQRIGG